MYTLCRYFFEAEVARAGEDPVASDVSTVVAEALGVSRILLAYPLEPLLTDAKLGFDWC